MAIGWETATIAAIARWTGEAPTRWQSRGFSFGGPARHGGRVDEHNGTTNAPTALRTQVQGSGDRVPGLVERFASNLPTLNVQYPASWSRSSSRSLLCSVR